VPRAIVKIRFLNHFTQVWFLLRLGGGQLLLSEVGVIHRQPLVVVPVAEDDVCGAGGGARRLLALACAQRRLVRNLVVGGGVLHVRLDLVGPNAEIRGLAVLAGANLLWLLGEEAIAQRRRQFSLREVHGGVLAHHEVGAGVVDAGFAARVIRVKVGFRLLLAALSQLLLQSYVHY
jgi:hypothetical protein